VAESKGVVWTTAEVKAVSSDGPGEFEAVISVPTIDRDGEVVAKGAFNPLPGGVPIHVDHRMDSEGLVGTGRPYYAGDELRLKGTFAGTPRAQIIRQLVVEGHLGAMSVGFMDAKRVVKDGVPTITKAELLEVSFVTVPSNREALVVAAKDAAVKRGARNSKQDAERIQAAHDLFVDLGAACPLHDDDAEKSATDTDPDDKAAAPAAAEDRPADVNLVDQVLAAAARATAVLATTE
jgi:HK97 family phage prohead protease